LVATIALAEISRQVGRRPTFKVPTGPRPPIYDSALEELAGAAGEIAIFEELMIRRNEHNPAAISSSIRARGRKS